MSLACVAGALGACSHTQAPAAAPEAKQAVNETRGQCPTDLEQSQAALETRSDGFALVFTTRDDSQREALYDRARALAAALATPHHAVNSQGQLIDHPAVPSTPEVREHPFSTPGHAVELVINAPAEQRAALKSDLEDHLRLWLSGECPELSDRPLRASAPTDPRQRVDR
jgi:hypothetical protein